MTPSGGRVTVAHVVWSLDTGGLERVVVDLIRGLDGERFQSDVYCLAAPGALAGRVEDHCRHLAVLEKRPGRSYLLPVRLAAAFRRRRIDIVHAHNFGPLVYAAAGARLARVPRVVYTAHGPEASQRADFGRVDRVRRIDRVIAVSEHVREVAVRDGGLDPARVTTIYNGVHLGHFGAGDAGTRRRVRAELGLDDGDIAIGSVARLSPEKDHVTLLSAFSVLARTHPRARLLLAGDGEQRTALERAAAGLGVSGQTQFLGTRDDVPELLSAFDLFALSSRIEGLGITLIEAMAAGLPAVATSAGGIPEVVTADTGVTVPPGDPGRFADALAWMIEHPARARAMGAAGRARAGAHFGVDVMVRRYEEMYAGLR